MANVILYSQLGYRPLIWRSISCYILARWIEDHGYTCQVIEFSHLFSSEELVEYTKMFIDNDTILIGASSTMWSSFSSEILMGAVAKEVPENLYKALIELKKEFSKIKTLVGGPRGYAYLKNIEIFDHIADISFGENWLLKFLDELTDKNLSTKLRRKQFNISNHRFVYKDHDCILPGESLPLEWGRGCIFKCPFCRSPELGKKSGTLEKNTDLMVDQLIEMYERFGTKSYWFIDETFNADNSRIENLYEVHKKLPFQLEFSCYMRPDLLDKNPHTQDMIYESGLRGTLFGIETFNKEASKLVLKPWSHKRGKDFLQEIFEKWPNTHIDCSFLVGLPGESEEDLYKTADWLTQTKLGFFWFIPLFMNRDERYGIWEKTALKEGVSWPDPSDNLDWVRDDWSWIKAYNVSSKLNRYINSQSRMGMWGLGAMKTAGVDFNDTVNKKREEIFEKLGDIYDHQARLFNKYKELLKLQAGR